MKKNNKKGFTLAELLIVVAIIAVLVAIAIPVFSAQLEKAKESTDMANIRSAYATLVAKYLEDNSPGTITVQGAGQDTADWKTSGAGSLQGLANGSSYNISFNPGKTYTVSIDNSGSVSVTPGT